jgi:GNAT superfamily N-acetyltransferase
VTGYSTPRPISDVDDAATFDSGEPTLDDYLRTRALANHGGGASRCFVTCRDGRIVGYYALASGAVSHADWSGKFRRNMPDPIPVILLSRLAIDRKHQGCGLGENLLRDAIARSVQVAQQIGVRAILVHALHDEARRFYTRYQFEPSPTDPLHLMLLIKDAKASVVGLRGETDDTDHRRETIEALVASGADRDHLESLTDDQFLRLMSLMALTHAEQLRELFPDGATSVLAVAREATGVVDRELRLVALSDGTGVLVDADCDHTTEDEARDAVEGDD